MRFETPRQEAVSSLPPRFAPFFLPRRPPVDASARFARPRPSSFLPAVLVLAALAPVPALAAGVANGNVVCNATGTQANPSIAADAAGGAYIVWRDNRANSEIYLQHLDTNGNVVAGWAANGNPIENLATAGTLPLV